MKLKPIIGPYSILGLFNLAILQWLGVRLEASVDNGKDRNIESLSLIGFIVPWTGWRFSGEYNYIGPEWKLKIWSLKNE